MLLQKMSKNIVIVGGGFAGIMLAGSLEKALLKANHEGHRIILVEKKSHFYHAIAGLRSAVIDWDSKIMIPYINLFQNKNNKVVQASAEKFLVNELVLDQSVEEFGHHIPYDYMILATGTAYPFPGKVDDVDYETARCKLQALREQVKSAQSIVIVGGGTCGIELSGEIRDVYKDKKITIVHPHSTFLSDFADATEKSKNDVLNLVHRNNIDTVFNDAVVLPVDLKESFYTPVNGIVNTKQGQAIQDVDLVMLAFGNRPQTAWLKNTAIGAQIVSDNGYIKVKDTFQVDHPELPNVFVLGDAANFNESKLALRLKTHVPIITNNIVQAVVHKTQPTGVHTSTTEHMFIPFGQNDGIGYMPLPWFGGLYFGGWFVSRVKSRSLMTGKSWSFLNLTEPLLDE